MPSDLEQTRLGYFNSGLALADQFGQGMELKLKRQQLASQEAARRIQERKLTADLEMIELEKQKLGAEIKQRALADAEWLNVNTSIAQRQAAFDTALDAGVSGPAPDFTALRDQAAMQLAGHNSNAQKYLAGRVQVENFKGDIARRQRDEQLLPLEIEAKIAATEADRAKVAEIEAAKNFTPRGMIDPVTGATIVEKAPGQREVFAPPTRTQSIAPEIQTLQGPDGKPISVLRTGPNTWQRLESKEERLSNMGQMISERQAALAKGDTESVRIYDEHFAGRGMQLQFDSEGRVIGMTEGPLKGAAATPQAVVSRLTERINQSRQGVTDLVELQATVRSKDVGPKGWFGETFLDKLAPAFGITWMQDPKRISTREKIHLLRESLMKDVSGDTRFNMADRSAIEKALPSTGFVESKGNIQQVSEVLKHMLAKRTVLDATDLKQLPPKWTFDILPDQAVSDLERIGVLPPETLLKLIEDGSLTRERAIKIHQMTLRPR